MFPAGNPEAEGLLCSLLLILWALSQVNHHPLSLMFRHFGLEAGELSQLFPQETGIAGFDRNTLKAYEHIV